MEPINEHAAHRPGAVSLFFVYKAGLFAACFWAWLAVLAVLGGAATGWHLVAAAGAMTTTLVGVGLGVRHALQRNAAVRHEQMMRVLVDMSWHSFAQAARGMSLVDNARDDNARDRDARDTDARDRDVIPLAPATRRPRR